MREIIWVEDKFKKEIECIDDVYVLTNEKKNDIIKGLLDNLGYYKEDVDSSVLELKAKALSAREMYKKVVDEEIDAMEKLWEGLDSKRRDINKKTTMTRDVIKEISDDVNKLRKELSQLDVYGMDKMLEVLNKFKNMSDEDKLLLSKLLV